MDKLQKVLIAAGFVILSCALLVLVFIFLQQRNTPVPQTQITSRSVIDRIKDQYFVVTKTVVIDQESQIAIDQGSSWSNLFWGQTIDAESLIRIDIGVDMSQLEEGDVEIDEVNKKIIINLPQASILDASQFGDIEVTSKQGILKFFLDNNPNKDHNLALAKLIEEAKASIQDDQKLFDEARTDSIKLLELIIKDMGYTLEIRSNK